MKKPSYQVVAGFLERDGKFLLVQRPPGKKNEGLWEFPGGKVEKEETLEEALKRELKEELGIDVLETNLIGKVFYDYGNFQIELFLLKVVNFKGNIQLKEAKDFKWVDIETALKLELCEADKLLLKNYFLKLI